VRPNLKDPTNPATILYTVAVKNSEAQAWYRNDLMPIVENSEPIEQADQQLLEKMMYQRVQDLYFAARQLDQWLTETEQSATSKNHSLESLRCDLDVALVKFEGTAIQKLYEMMDQLNHRGES
jgi:hypothetical protein